MNGNRQQSITFIHLLTFFLIYIFNHFKRSTNLVFRPSKQARQDSSSFSSYRIQKHGCPRHLPSQQDDDNPPQAFYG